MSIPPNITKDHVLLAIAEIDGKHYDPIYESKTYVLKLSGKFYPPKYVVRIANRFANGRELDSSNYISLEANRLLEKLGFTIAKIPSREGERQSGRDTSLAGLILRDWVEDGKPSLSWDELLRRTVAADQELENQELNPARVFRRHRHENNTGEMQRYIAGFYEYEFAPNYNPRVKKGGRPAAPQEPATASVPPESSGSRRSAAEIVIDLVKRVESILAQLEPRGFNQDLASWINGLERKGRVPQHVKFRMHAIRSIRNKVVHHDYKPSPAEMAALESDWAMIDEWWHDKKA